MKQNYGKLIFGLVIIIELINIPFIGSSYFTRNGKYLDLDNYNTDQVETGNLINEFTSQGNVNYYINTNSALYNSNNSNGSNIDYSQPSYYNYNSYNNSGYYVVDYNQDYYEAVKYFNYNTSNCLIHNQIDNYCAVEILKYNRDMYLTYSCYYNTNQRSYYCKFPFVKTRKFISYITNYSYNYTNYNQIGTYQYSYQSKQYIYVPANGHLNTYGTARECDYGFVADYSAQKCKLIEVPSNATLNKYGTDWTCNFSYIKNTTSKSCDKISLPEYAYYNTDGTDWLCIYGYKKNISSKICDKVIVPGNAHLSSDGSSRDCNSGYKRVNDKCVADN